MRRALITALLCTATVTWAQISPDTTYSVEVTTTASPMLNFFRHPKVPGTNSKTSFGYGLSVRAAWHPARLLAVGILTGYYVIARDEISSPGISPEKNFDATLSSVPLQLSLSMQKAGWEFGMGIGPYLMMTSIGGGGSASVTGSRLEIGMTFFGSFGFQLADNVRIGPELRVIALRYRGIVSVMPSISFRVDPLRY